MNNFGRESGAALVVSLLLLMVMTMVGLSTSRVSILDEMIAGAVRDRELAFYAAEAARVSGESSIIRNVNGGSLPSFDGVSDSAGLVTQVPASPGYYQENVRLWENMQWDSNTHVVKHSIKDDFKVASDPSYYVEQLSTDGMGVYRVTARGIGGSTNVEVVVQSKVSFTETNQW